MNWLLTAMLSLSLALPAGQIVQLCNHESGSSHIFSGDFCDGTLAHGHASRKGQHPASSHHDHHHPVGHGHNHSDDHSQHATAGEHHEPCSHELFTPGDDRTRASSAASVITEFTVSLLPAGQPTLSVLVPRNVFRLDEPHTRGPSGFEDPLRQFASCVRLTL